MELTGKRLLVTGGAGFIGSHLCEALLPDNEVRVVDQFSNGSPDWVPDGCELIEGDLAEEAVLTEAVTADLDGVFHLAADRSVATDDPTGQFRANNRLTERLLERMAAVDVRSVLFTSSSTVYGEAPRPTPEDHTPLEPISAYGASKLACEALLSVYAHSHGFTVWNVRFANIVGPRLQLGAVIPDFIDKLARDPEELEILGDGRQEKSYMHVEDCVAAIEHVVERAENGPVHTFNLGTRTTTSVMDIADIVAAEMGLDPEYAFTGGERGWTGDVPRMRLSVDRLVELGFEPGMDSDEAVGRAVRELIPRHAPAYADGV
jgi:UDP-glucose 4-epimerase